MNFFIGDASEVYKLGVDLMEASAGTALAMRGVMAEGGKVFEEQWRSNAEATSGEHGRFYPRSISSELVFDASGISVDVGPDAFKKQGSMGRGFEFGSENQPPHLDGLRAYDWVAPRVERMADTAMAYLLP